MAYQFVQPAPPRNIVIATGQPEGSYNYFGREYRKILARDDINLEVRVTAGSVENLRLLERGEVDVAFLQGGLSTLARSDAFISLGSLYYEPVWVFYRSDLPIKEASEVKGHSIDIGGKEMGGRIVAQQALDFIRITPEDTPITYFGARELRTCCSKVGWISPLWAKG